MHLQHLYYLGLLTATAAATPQQPKCCQISTWYNTNYLLDYCYNHKVKCQKFTQKLPMIGVCRTTLNEIQQQTKKKTSYSIILDGRYDIRYPDRLLVVTPLTPHRSSNICFPYRVVSRHNWNSKILPSLRRKKRKLARAYYRCHQAVYICMYI